MQFAASLSTQFARLFTDGTGLKGKYDFTLTCSMESLGFSPTRARTVDTGAPAAPEPESAPTIMEAAQRQLGLKLEQKKVFVDVLVVDHAEKAPIAN